MSPEKDEDLCTRHPRLYAQRNLGMQGTCMCWGFDCGDGWFDIINDLSGVLEKINNQGDHRVEASQVKEKYGGLRFYTSYVGDWPEDAYKQAEDAIKKAESRSYETCEVCGKPGKCNDRGWIMCRCPGHEAAGRGDSSSRHLHDIQAAAQTMSNAEIIETVKAYQSIPCAHPLTCAKDSNHAILEPVLKDGKVILRCPTCGNEQVGFPLDILSAGVKGARAIQEQMDDLASDTKEPG